MGIFNTGIPLGSIICFNFFGEMGSLWGWRVPVLLTGCYSFIVGMCFVTFYQAPSPQEIKDKKPVGIYQSLKEIKWPIWAVGASWLWYNAGVVCFVTFAPDLFLQSVFNFLSEDSDFPE